MYKVVPVPAFRDNYIWLLVESASASPAESTEQQPPTRCAVIDPGDAKPVLTYCDQMNLVPVALLITHHHADHIGGIKELTSAFDVDIYGPRGEAIDYIQNRVGGGDHVALPGRLGEWSVLDVPGHTSGHIAYYSRNILFCGDTLFGAGCGRLFEGTPQQMYASLQKLANLPTNTKVFCAHEYTLANLGFAQAVEPDNLAIRERIENTKRLRGQNESTVPFLLETELATNPFLRCREPEVIAAAERRCKRPLTGPSDVFAVLRQWKDEW